MIQEERRAIKAIIFDMDGVIIDSAGLWKKAEKHVFSSVGVTLSDELCKLTETMTTTEVTNFWFNKDPWKDKALEEVEQEVIERVAYLIDKEGKAINGVRDLITNLKDEGYKIGLATNSPSVLIPVVLEKLKLTNYFDAISSAEHMQEGKPNPSVYLSVAKQLNSKPTSCVAVEDSCSGLLAAKKAGMKTIAVLNDDDDIDDVINQLSDYKINNYNQFDFSFLN